MVPEFPSRIARVGAVLTVIGSLIWVQWPVDFAKFNFAALILFVASLMTWVSIELADASNNSKSNDYVLLDDVDKINSLISIMDKNQYYIIKNKAIQTYMDEDDYDGILKIISLHENDIFPFHNKNIQAAYDAFCNDARAFYREFYGLYTSDGRGRSTWKPSGERWVEDEIYKQVMSKIAALDRKASALSESWEALINLARQELKGASKAVDRYEM
ncbi:hypothetical protein [Pararhizobium gei]|uniref:hypothetical protein n=1 Tax=Pararhizobium gei TaxID=1395951 RepID=UPI0023DCAA47|nr:hypothetical protein [Rhizobium gei]